MNESHRCPHCERLLDTASRLQAGECGCRHQPGDVRLSHTGIPFLAIWDRYAKTCAWVELIPAGGTQHAAPCGPLLARKVDGKTLPALDTTDGDLFAVKSA